MIRNGELISAIELTAAGWEKRCKMAVRDPMQTFGGARDGIDFIAPQLDIKTVLRSRFVDSLVWCYGFGEESEP